MLMRVMRAVHISCINVQDQFVLCRTGVKLGCGVCLYGMTIVTELRILLIACVVLFSSFLILQDTSLAVAVWAVPMVSLVRLLSLLVVLRKILELRMADMLHAFRSALVLSAAGMCVATIVYDSSLSSSIGLMSFAAGCCTIALLLVFRFNWMLGEPLAVMVRAKFSTGRLGTAPVWLEKGTS